MDVLQLTIPGMNVKQYSLLRKFTHSDIAQWDLDLLAQLPSVHLTCLCKMLGLPSSGNSFKKICNIVRWRTLALIVKGKTPEQLANELSTAQLSIYINLAPSKVWRSASTKYQKATVLCNWYLSSIANGKKFIARTRKQKPNG